jgi:hypothetical protein
MEETNTSEVKTCSKCGSNKKSTTKEEKKCSKCDKAKQQMMPIVIFSLIFFSFAVYGAITFVKDMIFLFSK